MSFCLTSISKPRQRTKSKQSKMQKSYLYVTTNEKLNNCTIINKKLKHTNSINYEKKNSSNRTNTNSKVEIIYSKKNRCNSNTYYNTIDNEL